MSRALQLVSIKEIENIPKPKDLRMDVSELKALARSIQQNGLQQVVRVRKTKTGYQLIDGRHRTAAHVMLKRTEIEAVVDDADDKQAAVGTIVANMYRKDMPAYEEARAFLECSNAGLKQIDIAAQCGVTQSYVSKRLALLKIPAVVAMHAGTAFPVEDVKRFTSLVGHDDVAKAVAAALGRRKTAAWALIRDVVAQNKAWGLPLEASWLQEATRMDWSLAHAVTRDTNYRRAVKAMKTVELDGHVLCLDKAKAGAAAKAAAERLQAKKPKQESRGKDPKTLRLERIGRKARELQRDALVTHMRETFVDQDTALRLLVRRSWSALVRSSAKADVAALQDISGGLLQDGSTFEESFDRMWRTDKDGLLKIMSAWLYFDQRRGSYGDAERAYCVDNDELNRLCIGTTWKEIHKQAVAAVDGTSIVEVSPPRSKKASARPAAKKLAAVAARNASDPASVTDGEAKKAAVAAIVEAKAA